LASLQVSSQVFYEPVVFDIDSLERLLPDDRSERRAEVLLLLSSQLVLSDNEKCTEYAREAFEIATERKDERLLLHSKSALGLAAHHRGDYPAAIGYGLEALEMAQDQKDTVVIAPALTFVILSYLYSDNDDLAIRYLQTANPFFAIWTDPVRSFDLNIRFGWVYMATEHFSEAIPYFRKCAEIADSSQIIPLPNQILNLRHLGWCYMNTGHYDSSLYLFRTCYALLEVDTLLFMEVLSDIGDCFYQMKNLDSAEYYYTKTLLEMRESNNNVSGIGGISYQLGTLYAEERNWKEALECFREAIRSGQWVFETGCSLVDDQSNIDSWYDPVQNVPGYVEMIGLNLWASGLKGAANVSKALKDFEQAFRFLEQYNDKKSKLDDLKQKRDVIHLSTRYESERKEQQVQLLSQQNQLTALKLKQTRYFLFGLLFMVGMLILLGILLIRQSQMRSEQQTSLLQQKLFRAQMNPHFIFNALSGIQGFIIEKDHMQAGIYLSRFAKLVRNILDSSVKDAIPLTTEMETISHYLELQKVRYEGKFDYCIDIDEGLPTADVHIPPMLIQPFVENAIEHGIKYKPGKGMVRISFQLTDGGLNILITDDGIGRKKALKFEQDRNKYRLSLSTQIIQDRIRSLNRRSRAKYSLQISDLADENGDAAGTRVVVFIPIAER
jgi:tetratricopeptide (TPR) repeat protein